MATVSNVQCLSSNHHALFYILKTNTCNIITLSAKFGISYQHVMTVNGNVENMLFCCHVGTSYQELSLSPRHSASSFFWIFPSPLTSQWPSKAFLNLSKSAPVRSGLRGKSHQCEIRIDHKKHWLPKEPTQNQSTPHRSKLQKKK